jgi:hypothetical protein
MDKMELEEGSTVVEIPEEEKEKLIEELEEIIQTVPYSLAVALIKMCQINKYAPLEIEKYYEHILPTFHLLRRTDGSKYQSNSIKTVRSAMLSSKLFHKNDDGLYVLNLKNAIKHIKQMQKKRVIPEKNETNNVPTTEESNKENVVINSDVELNKINNEFNDYSSKMETKPKKKYKKDYLGKKRKIKGIMKDPEYKNTIKKYATGFELLNNLLKISSNDRNVCPQLNYDFEAINNIDLNSDNQSNDKIVGMLTVFRFFKPFLEKSINSFRVHEKMIQKLSELNNEVNYIKAIHSSQT